MIALLWTSLQNIFALGSQVWIRNTWIGPESRSFFFLKCQPSLWWLLQVFCFLFFVFSWISVSGNEPLPGSRAWKITVFIILQPVPSREHGAGYESFLLGPWPWLTSTVSRSGAKRNSWLKELEIKRRVASHMAHGCWWNETCQTSQGLSSGPGYVFMCSHTKGHSAESSCWRTSDDFWYKSFMTQRLQCATCLQKLIDSHFIWHVNLSHFAKISFCFFTIKKNTWSL